MVERLAAGVNGTGTGYDVALVVELDGRDALAEYRAHPDHEPVLARSSQICRAVEVADFDG